MIGSEAAVGVYYSGDAITMIDDNPDLAWVFPEEGTVLSVDSMAIPATSEHEEAAEMFINFMCEPDVGKANIEYIGYTTPMHCVWDILDEDLKYSEIAYPSEDIAAKEEVFTALSDEVNSELDVKWSEMKSYDEGGSGYLFRTATVQDFSAVTGACLLVKTSVWDEVKGLDEAFAVAFNDVDFCLRVRDAGYRIAWTPYAQLTHYESKSRGGDEKDPVKARRFAAEQQRLYEVHGKENILHDPYYNPNLTMDREDFSESDDLRGLKEGRITVQWRE